jgi:hypothetical protein
MGVFLSTMKMIPLFLAKVGLVPLFPDGTPGQKNTHCIFAYNGLLFTFFFMFWHFKLQVGMLSP